MLLGAIPAVAAGCVLLFEVIERLSWGGHIREDELYVGLMLLTGSAFTGYFIISTWRKPSEHTEQFLLDLPTETLKPKKLTGFQKTAGVLMILSALALLVFFLWALNETLMRANRGYYNYGPQWEEKLALAALAVLFVCMMAYAIATFVGKRHNLHT